jgi:hypothetical protein
MGNTVGSQRKLTKRQEEVLIGTILGDGVLELNGRYPRLRIDHSAKQKEYVRWKYKIFSNFISGKIRYFMGKRNKKTGKKYTHCKFDTISSPVFERFYKAFYQNGKKKIPKNIKELLKSPLSLAVWFMDDGYKRNDCNALRINTDRFALGEQKLLMEALKENFGIRAKLHRKGKCWNIYIPSSESKKFSRLIGKYVIKAMRYKLPLTP